MSFAADLVDKVLVHVTASVTGVTVRNALTETFLSEDQIGPSLLPWCQGFNVSSESTPGDFGQRIAQYELNFELLEAANRGNETWTDITTIREAILADWTLTDSVQRVWMSAAEVDETSSRDLTLGAFQITCLVVE